MRSAAALAVGWIEGRSAVFPFDDVIGKHPMLGLSLGATLTSSLVYVFATPAGSCDDRLAPHPILMGAIEWIDFLRLRATDTSVKLPNAGRDLAKLSHPYTKEPPELFQPERLLPKLILCSR